MSVSPPRSERPSGAGELTALLWVIAVLLAALELAWWLFGHMYAS
jgi:hypothetical protein